MRDRHAIRRGSSHPRFPNITKWESHGKVAVPASAIFQLEIDCLKRWVSELYRLYLAVWETQGKERTPELVRAIFLNGIVPLIQTKKENISGELRRYFRRTGSSDGILDACLQELEHMAPRIESEWRQKTEAEARRLEYEGQKHPNGDSPWGEIDHELFSLRLVEVSARLNDEFESGLKKIHSQQVSGEKRLLETLKADALPGHGGQHFEVKLELIPQSEPAQTREETATHSQSRTREPTSEESKVTHSPSGRLRDDTVTLRNNVIANLKNSFSGYLGVKRNKKIAKALDEQGIPPPPQWSVRTFTKAREVPQYRKAFDRMVSRAREIEGHLPS